MSRGIYNFGSDLKKWVIHTAFGKSCLSAGIWRSIALLLFISSFLFHFPLSQTGQTFNVSITIFMG